MIGTTVRRITGARLESGTPCDLRLSGGTVSEVGTADPTLNSTGPEHLHLPGWFLLPSAVEPHAHVDKAFSWSGAQEYGDLGTAISSWHEYAETMSAADIYMRARRAFRTYLANGITAVRTHVDLLPGTDPLRGLIEVIRIREELRDLMDIQVAVLFPRGSEDGILQQAVDLGVDVVGGCPHLASDPIGETVRLLDLADRTGLPIDLHTDEQCSPEVLSIRALAAEVGRRGFGRVTASHCVSLGALPERRLGPVIEEIRAAGLMIVSLPITNLYLQGRSEPVHTPRGITALHALSAAGVTVAAGGDNVRDPFNPMGRADPFETTSLLITAGHLSGEQAVHMVTTSGRRVLGLAESGPVAGQDADLLAVRAESLADVLAGSITARIVLRRGRVVSRTTVTTENAIDIAQTMSTR